MKIHLVLILSILGGEWANGTVQTSLNQDKPPYVSVQNVNITLNGYSSASQASSATGLEQYNGSLVGGSTSGGGSWTYLYYDIPYSEYDWGQNYSWSWSNPSSYIQSFSLWQVLYPPYDETSTNDGPFCLPEVVCDYYYFYTNWVLRANVNGVPSPQDRYYAVEESTTANTSITLHTGGKSTSKQRNVFALNGWGASQMVPNHLYFGAELFDASSWCGYYGGGTNFPAQSVSLGSLGALDNNGNEYAGLPDNATVDVTPQVADTPCYVFNIGSVQKYILTMTANGINLSASTPEFCVGQQVTLSNSFDPPLPAGMQASYQWVVSLDFMNDNLNPVNPDGSYYPYINPALLTNNPTPVWWYGGGYGFIWCTATVQLPNGQTAAATGEGNVSIYRPTISNFVDSPPSYPTNCLDGGTLYLQLGDNNAHGDMNYEVDVLSSYSGQAGIIQLINRNASNGSFGSGSLGTDGQFWLDTSYLYMVSPVRPFIEAPINFSDGPGVADVASGLSLTTSCSDQFRDYVVFRPSAGNANNNIWVTLGIISGGNPSWSWSASTTWFGGWSTPTGSVTRPTWPDNSDSFPTWVHTYQNSQ